MRMIFAFGALVWIAISVLRMSGRTTALMRPGTAVFSGCPTKAASRPPTFGSLSPSSKDFSLMYGTVQPGRRPPPGSGRGPSPAGDTAGPGGRRRAPSGSGGAGDPRHPRRDDRCHAGADRRSPLRAGPDRFGAAAGHRPRPDHDGPARLIRVGPGLARTRPRRRAGTALATKPSAADSGMPLRDTETALLREWLQQLAG